MSLFSITEFTVIKLWIIVLYFYSPKAVANEHNIEHNIEHNSYVAIV